MRFGRLLLLGVLVWHVKSESGAARSDAIREGSTIACPQGASERISLRSTDRVPEASGAIRMERMGGTTKLEVEVDSMKPASLFGGDYNTYVLWVVPPSGAAENLGEIVLDGNNGKVRASTKAISFALLVTAEPHFLVSSPSAFVILENKRTGHQPIQYRVLEGVYNFKRATLENEKEAKGVVHSEVRQAFTAVRLAQRAGAEDVARAEFRKAERALNQTINLWHQQVNRDDIAAQARETVRLAVAAQRLATDRGLRESRIEMEGSGGGNDQTGSRDQRGPEFQ
jgi:hypothetical protein